MIVAEAGQWDMSLPVITFNELKEKTARMTLSETLEILYTF